jgi:hypothetical protein
MVAAACGDAVADAPAPNGPTHLQIRQSPSPFQQVSAGPVSTLIPDAWEPRLAGAYDDPRQGIVAGPRPGTWGLSRPPLEGLAAMWVDGTAVGVPSDYYYLAATGPALDAITGSELCRATRQFVVSNHRPAFAKGEPDSPGDYVAHGQGTCSVGRRPARWAYFVAAPGFGPVRELGIPTSSLYVVVADRVQRGLGRGDDRRGDAAGELTQRGERSTKGGRTTFAGALRPRMSTSTSLPCSNPSAGDR